MITTRVNRIGRRVGLVSIPLALLLAGVAVVAMPRANADNPCPAEGDCFEEHGNPGCQDEECCDTVCLISRGCCLTRWDRFCVSLAEDLCEPVPTEGACCIPGLVCVVETEAVCVDIGGQWLGGGIQCNQETCPTGPIGACCVDGQCVEVSEAACGTLGGWWKGADTECIGVDVCTPEGACCIIDTCQMLSETECNALGSGATYMGDFVECVEGICDESVPWGACCFESEQLYGVGLCAVVPEAACFLLQGIFWLEDVSCEEADCPNFGACCIDGECVQTSQDICEATGENFGLGVDCYDDLCADAPVGCCIDGECSVLPKQTCSVLGGVIQPTDTCDDVVCDIAPPTGACCLPDPYGGRCVEVKESICATLGGTWQGQNVFCDEVECPIGCVGDTNGDAVINTDDLNNILGCWGTTGVFCPDGIGTNTDVVPDGQVTFDDLVKVLGCWGACS